MGVVKWLLGIHFSWYLSKGDVDVHMDQSGFSRNLIKKIDLQHKFQTPNATPYCNGIPIDAIATADPEDESPAQKRRTAAYQSIVGSVGWLCNNTSLHVSNVHSFRSSYLMHPAPGHMQTVLYVL